MGTANPQRYMFFVTDTLETRQSKIRSFVKTEPAIAVLLAAMDFEWTVRRAILALGVSPTKAIHAQFGATNSGGLSGLNEHWKLEVTPRLRIGLPAVVPDWNQLKTKAFVLRHKLIHGVQGNTGINFAGRVVEQILAASSAVAKFAEANGAPVYGINIRRLKPRC